MFPITSAALLHVMPRSKAVVEDWVEPLQNAMLAFGISNSERQAMFVAQIAHESAELTALEENLNYSAKRLRQVFPRFFPDDEIAARYAGNPEAIASRVYGSRLGNGPEESGDGYRFRGRGPIGVTFRANYGSCSVAICGDINVLLDNPEYLTYPEFGAASAGWYWDLHDCGKYADAGDFDGVCDAVNIGHKTIAMGDSNGFADRLHYLRLAREAFL